MATRNEVLACLRELVIAYPRQEIPTETLEAYVEDLEDYGAGLLLTVCRHARRSEKFFPSIARLCELANEERAVMRIEGNPMDSLRPATARELEPVSNVSPSGHDVSHYVMQVAEKCKLEIQRERKAINRRLDSGDERISGDGPCIGERNPGEDPE